MKNKDHKIKTTIKFQADEGKQCITESFSLKVLKIRVLLCGFLLYLHFHNWRPTEYTITEFDFEIEINGDNPIGVQITKAIIYLKINFN